MTIQSLAQQLRSKGRFPTRDTALTFRMGAGSPGDVTRSMASILPNLVDPTNPPTAFGQAVLVDGTSHGVRVVLGTDTSITKIWGVTARPYPYQAATATNYGAADYGSGAPALAQPCDVVTAGYVLVPVVGTPVKGGAVFIWTSASGSGHTLGGFESAAHSTSSVADTVALDTSKYAWNSGPGANGLAELKIEL